MHTNNEKLLKTSVALFVCLLFRLMPWRTPNIEPVLTAQMPLSQVFGPVAGFIFGISSIMLYDFVTGTVGLWTFITGATYGALGVLAYLFFRKKKPTAWNFAVFAILGTIFFDAITGLTVGPIFFGQSLYGALLGQIPFTLWHLLGNVSFAFILSPTIYNFFIRSEKLEKKYEKHKKIHIVA